MKTSASILNIVPALINAQGAFPPIVKTKTAEIKGDKANFTFSYAPLDEILHVLKPTLQANGLALIQGVEGFNLETTLFHQSGEWITHSMEMPHNYTNPRAYGSELSYRRRYSVTSVLGVVAEDDDDGQAAERDRLGTGKKKESGASPTSYNRECFEAMTPEEQEFIRKILGNLVALLDEGRNAEAYTYLEKQRLDDKEKPALWSLLDSKKRSAIKKAGEFVRAKEAEEAK